MLINRKMPLAGYEPRNGRDDLSISSVRNEERGKDMAGGTSICGRNREAFSLRYMNMMKAARTNLLGRARKKAWRKEGI